MLSEAFRFQQICFAATTKAANFADEKLLFSSEIFIEIARVARFCLSDYVQWNLQIQNYSIIIFISLSHNIKWIKYELTDSQSKSKKKTLNTIL